ncbi:MAG: hypothetical protein KGK44_10875 [Gammaproteobacteria bacterium]|nr:hypothetical protein [Gammaproteobacteria bacterium]
MAEPIVLSEQALAALNAARPWMRFLAIVGLILASFAVIGGLAVMAGALYSPFFQGATARFVRVTIGALYIAFAIFLYVIPCLYLHRYARAIQDLPASGQAGFEHALTLQKSFWKYLGIFTIVVLSLYVLFLFGFILFALLYSAAHTP